MQKNAKDTEEASGWLVVYVDLPAHKTRSVASSFFHEPVITAPSRFNGFVVCYQFSAIMMQLNPLNFNQQLGLTYYARNRYSEERDLPIL